MLIILLRQTISKRSSFGLRLQLGFLQTSASTWYCRSYFFGLAVFGSAISCCFQQYFLFVVAAITIAFVIHLGSTGIERCHRFVKPGRIVGSRWSCYLTGNSTSYRCTPYRLTNLGFVWDSASSLPNRALMLNFLSSGL